tara:strand:- start:10197 stop:10841 length:645 start_codon:yes stop_codon:yes gene_type:complete
MNKYPKKLIIIGDSGVYGWGDIEGGGWCERLRQNWLKSENSPIIYSLGVRGDGLEKVAKRFRHEWEARGELRRKVPEGILLAIGLNDSARIGRKDGRPQLSEDAFKFGLKRLINEIKKEVHVMVLGLTPVNEDVMPFADCLWYSNESCSKYEKKIEEACLDLNIPFFALHKKMINITSYKSLILSDGIHINSEGHKWIFDQISEWSPLRQWAEL